MRLPFNLIIDRGSKISPVMPPHSLLNAELQGPLLQVRKQFILFDNAGLSWGDSAMSAEMMAVLRQRSAIQARAETTFFILFTSTFNLLKQLSMLKFKKPFSLCRMIHASALTSLGQPLPCFINWRKTDSGNYVKGEWKCRGHKTRRDHLQILTLRFLFSPFMIRRTPGLKNPKKCTGSTHKIKHIKYWQRNLNW